MWHDHILSTCARAKRFLLYDGVGHAFQRNTCPDRQPNGQAAPRKENLSFLSPSALSQDALQRQLTNRTPVTHYKDTLRRNSIYEDNLHTTLLRKNARREDALQRTHYRRRPTRNALQRTHNKGCTTKTIYKERMKKDGLRTMHYRDNRSEPVTRRAFSPRENSSLRHRAASRSAIPMKQGGRWYLATRRGDSNLTRERQPRTIRRDPFSATLVPSVGSMRFSQHWCYTWGDGSQTGPTPAQDQPNSGPTPVQDRPNSGPTPARIEQ
jgi:hypothetical protein